MERSSKGKEGEYKREKTLDPRRVKMLPYQDKPRNY